MLYKLLSGRHTRIEGTDRGGNPLRKRYRPGDIIDLTRPEADKLGDRVQPHVPHIDDPVDDLEVLAAAEEAAPVEVEADTEADADADAEEVAAEEEPEESDEWVGLSEMTVREVEELVSSMDDAADLRAIYATEEAGKQRVGVFNAVRFRLAALSDPDAGEPDDSTE